MICNSTKVISVDESCLGSVVMLPVSWACVGFSSNIARTHNDNNNSNTRNVIVVF